jgi:hypothetical protein
MVNDAVNCNGAERPFTGAAVAMTAAGKPRTHENRPGAPAPDRGKCNMHNDLPG